MAGNETGPRQGGGPGFAASVVFRGEGTGAGLPADTGKGGKG